MQLPHHGMSLKIPLWWKVDSCIRIHSWTSISTSSSLWSWRHCRCCFSCPNDELSQGAILQPDGIAPHGNCCSCFAGKSWIIHLTHAVEGVVGRSQIPQCWGSGNGRSWILAIASPPISAMMGILNSCQGGLNTSMCSGIALECNDTTVDKWVPLDTVMTSHFMT